MRSVRPSPLLAEAAEVIVDEIARASYEVEVRARKAINALASGHVETQAAARQMVRLGGEGTQRRRKRLSGALHGASNGGWIVKRPASRA